MTKILLSGAPGKMIREIYRILADQGRIGELADFALSSQKNAGQEFEGLTLVGPAERDARVEGDVIAIDYSTPETMALNAAWFCRHRIPFVMGTTGGDLTLIHDLVKKSEISAVIAPNMAVPIVLLLEAARHLAESFPNALRDHPIQVTESHQAAKKDTSGTAKMMVKSLAGLGLDASPEKIEKIRDPARQREWGVPEEHLGAHAYHSYLLSDPSGTVSVELRHNVNGQRVYAEGTVKALDWLKNRNEKGQIYTMQDVLRN